jgi:hypothetical protein
MGPGRHTPGPALAVQVVTKRRFGHGWSQSGFNRPADGKCGSACGDRGAFGLLRQHENEYICGQLLDRKDRSDFSTALDMPDQTPVKGVMVKKKIVVGTRLELPRLKPGNMGQVRLVIESCSAFNPAAPCIRKKIFPPDVQPSSVCRFR